MIAALLALLLFAAPASAGTETLHVLITVTPGAGGAIPSMDGLQKGLQALFTHEFGRFVELSFLPVPPSGSADPVVSVRLGESGGAVSISTDMRRSGATRSLASTVPRGAPASLLSVIAGDISFLLFASRGFSTLPLAPAPGLTGIVQTDTLSELTGWNPEDLEPISLAAAGPNVTVCFPHAWLTLGPDFRIISASIRDLHALSGGREQLQLSGLAAGSGDQLILLSESAGKILRENPRIGTRQLIDAPGLPALSGLLLDEGTLAVLSGADGTPGLLLYSLNGGAMRRLAVAASYVSAFSRDKEGNIWAWDTGERRIRILTPAGSEVFSIKPLIPASTMQLPQQMEVLDDGGFLLAGSGEIWRFESTGIPVWRLARIPGRPGEQLPPSFLLAANGATGAFTILDQQSRRLIAFSAGPASAGLPALLTRLDGRRQGDLQEAAAAAESQGLSLIAWQLGDQLVRLGGSERDRAAAHIATLREKARLYVQYADSLSRDLLYPRADSAYLRAGETSRELAAESPGDPDGAQLVQSAVSRRLEVRSALARAPDLRIVSAKAESGRDAACGPTLSVHFHAVNKGTVALDRVKLHLALPSLRPTPALASLDLMAPDEEKDLDLTLGNLQSSLPDAGDLTAFILLTYDRGVEGVSSAFTLTVQWGTDVKAGNLARAIGCRVVANDPLLKTVVDDLAGFGGSSAPDAYSRFAAVFDSLSRLRAQTALIRGAEKPAVPVNGLGGAQSLRAILRGLSEDERDWALLSVSIAATLGLDAGLVVLGERVCALVNTDIPFGDAIASQPELGPFKALLEKISQGGTLWVPLGTQVAPVDSSPLAWSLGEALRLLASRDMESADMWRTTGAQSVAPPIPMPFPLVLP
jgi:hypothetical protein